MTWVVETSGWRRTGLVNDGSNDGYRTYVQFGPGGPFEWRHTKRLRNATPTEIAEKLGCRIEDLAPDDLAPFHLDKPDEVSK